MGSLGDDLLVGTASDDELTGDEGLDSLRGGLGNDSLSGDAGADDLQGGEGNDLLIDSPGEANLLDGGDGDDVLSLVFSSYSGLGTAGSMTTLHGGAGDDTLVLRLDAAALNAAAVDALLALRAAFSAEGSAAALGFVWDGIEHLAWVDLEGVAITQFAPAAANAEVSVDEDHSLSAQLPAARDMEGDAFSYALATAPAHGSVTVALDGSYVYTPMADFFGSDSFSYRVADATGGHTHTVAITVNAVDDAPVLRQHLPDRMVMVGVPLLFTLDELSFSDIDTPQLEFSAALVSAAALPAWLHFDALTFTFSGTPAAGDVGLLPVRVTARGSSASASDDFLLGVHATINRPPTSLDGLSEVTEDSVLHGVFPVATDVDTDIIRWDWATQPAHGVVVVQPDGHFDYTPEPNYSGPDSFRYELQDGRGGSTRFTQSINVLPVNDAATGTVQIVAGDDGLRLGGELTLLIDAADADGLASAVRSYAWLRNGQAIAGAVAATYTPGFDDVGALISVRVSFEDDLGHAESLLSPATAAVPAPAALDGSADDDTLGDEDNATPRVINGLAGDDTLIGGPADEQLMGGDGDDQIIGGGGRDRIDGGNGDDAISLVGASLTAGPNPSVVRGGEGEDLLRIALEPDKLSFEQALALADLRAHPKLARMLPALGLDVAGIEAVAWIDGAGLALGNVAPWAQDGSASTFEDTALNGVLPAGVDVDEQSLTYRVTSAPASGRLQWSTDGHYSYTPAADFFGSVEFNYQAFDGLAWSNEATQHLQVKPVNDAPRLLHALADHSLASGSSFSLALAGDAFVDPDNLGLADPPPLTVTLLLAGGVPLPSWLHFDPISFALTGTVPAGLTGLLRLEMSAADASSSTAAVFLLGTEPTLNQAPVALPTTATVDEDHALTGQLPAASDADGDATVFAWYANPQHGSLTLRADGSFTYVPEPDYFGADGFEYRVRDGRGGQSVAQVDLTVAPLNDAPTAGVKLVGLAQIGSLLQLDLSQLGDADGLPQELDITWLRNGVADLRDHANGFALGADDFGATIRVSVHFVDGGGTAETLFSAPTPAVGGVHRVTGTEGNDTLAGSLAPDRINGLGGNDRLSGGPLNDTLDGGSGVDTAVYAMPRAQATLNFSGLAFTVNSTAEGLDTLIGVERLAFSDAHVALDLTGHAGQAARTIGALFGADHLSDKALLGRELQLLDNGMAYLDVISAALRSSLFKQLAGVSHGAASHTQFVNKVYANLFGSAPSAEALNLYVGLLNDGSFTQATLAYAACEHAQNALNIDLVGLTTHGIEFTPPPGA